MGFLYWIINFGRQIWLLSKKSFSKIDKLLKTHFVQVSSRWFIQSVRKIQYELNSMTFYCNKFNPQLFISFSDCVLRFKLTRISIIIFVNREYRMRHHLLILMCTLIATQSLALACAFRMKVHWPSDIKTQSQTASK